MPKPAKLTELRIRTVKHPDKPKEDMKQVSLVSFYEDGGSMVHEGAILTKELKIVNEQSQSDKEQTDSGSED